MHRRRVGETHRKRDFETAALKIAAETCDSRVSPRAASHDTVRSTIGSSGWSTSGTTDVADRLVRLPSWLGLEENLEYVISALNGHLKSRNRR